MIRRPSTGMFCFVEILEKELVMKIKVGDKIDEIELPDTNGNMFKLSSTKGKKCFHFTESQAVFFVT
ncbi:MAG: hypothetical protein CM15mP117_03770 [Alphaproteobacteria bacterium]|nr:MAG: hypothetical protein CM15mP117_03770 [Alphaproteobacteria bacterium]